MADAFDDEGFDLSDDQVEEQLAASVRRWREEGATEPLFTSEQVLAALFGSED